MGFSAGEVGSEHPAEHVMGHLPALEQVYQIG